MHPQTNWADVLDHRFEIVNNRGMMVGIHDTNLLIPGSTLNLKCPSETEDYEELMMGAGETATTYICRRYGRGKSQALRYYPKPDFKLEAADMCENVGYADGPISHDDF